MQAQPRFLTILDYASALLLTLATGMVFFYAPTEATMGLVQKVFYFHTAAAWVGMLSFTVSVVAGILYLRTSNRHWDQVVLASVEIGMVFMLVAIILGSIWARPIWNTWWTWDPRLTTVTIMELIYAAYLMLRNGIEDPDRRARFGAVYVIVGFVSVPLTFFSIRIFRTIHPVVIGGSDPSATGSFDMTPRMLQTFLTALAVFSLIYVDVLWHRIRLGELSDKVEQLKLRLSA
jgi:heme exporter protein C